MIFRIPLLLAWMLCSWAPSSLAFAPPSMGLGAIFLKPSGSKTTPSLGDDGVLMEAADFFTDAFWASKLPGKSKELQPRQRKSLLNSQVLEFRRRYGVKAGKDRRAELLVTRNKQDIIMGCCGIEVDRIPKDCLEGETRTNAPLMSNVAVGMKFRRKGIAEDMVKAAEELARKEWGYEEVYLYVEKKNRAARKLYEKMGYRWLWEDDGARTIVPQENGSTANTGTTLVCMRKDLKRGLLSKVLPF